MSEPRRIARFQCSYGLIEAALKLPLDAKIMRIVDEGEARLSCWIIVEGDSLPYLVREGEVIPNVEPRYRRDESGEHFEAWT